MSGFGWRSTDVARLVDKCEVVVQMLPKSGTKSCCKGFLPEGDEKSLKTYSLLEGLPSKNVGTVKLIFLPYV